MWKQSSYVGNTVDFAPILPEDDYFHPVAADANYTVVETELFGFNIPAEDIQCNIYMLWHPVLKTMSVHIFVYRGARILRHHLDSDYFVEQLYLPTVEDFSNFSVQMGSCAVRFKVVKPLDEILIEFDDPQRNFNLHLKYNAALPPVGRPGGKHFTQLMKTSGNVTLDGSRYIIDGLYMRDRS